MTQVKVATPSINRVHPDGDNCGSTQMIGCFTVNNSAVVGARTDLEFISLCAPTERIDVIAIMWSHIEKLEAELKKHGVDLPANDIRS